MITSFFWFICWHPWTLMEYRQARNWICYSHNVHECCFFRNDVVPKK